MCDQQMLRPACAYMQSDQSLCWSLEYSMSVKLLTEQLLVFLSLKGGCTGSSESRHDKIPHCWKSHIVAHLSLRPLCLFLSVPFTQVLLYISSFYYHIIMSGSIVFVLLAVSSKPFQNLYLETPQATVKPV